MFENILLRKIFGSKIEKETGDIEIFARNFSGTDTDRDIEVLRKKLFLCHFVYQSSA